MQVGQIGVGPGGNADKRISAGDHVGTTRQDSYVVHPIRRFVALRDAGADTGRDEGGQRQLPPDDAVKPLW